ncbi:MAG TPA: hypothetical protein VFE45_07315, partial [Coriobacteriia bacterium]|nr:hypothetical protein [Coriobacteriia bacterium]
YEQGIQTKVATGDKPDLAFSKAAMTDSGVVLEFCAAQIVRVTPLRSAVASGHAAVAAPLGPELSVLLTLGSLHAVVSSPTATIAAAAVRYLFMRLLAFLRRPR